MYVYIYIALVFLPYVRVINCPKCKSPLKPMICESTNGPICAYAHVSRLNNHHSPAQNIHLFLK